MYARTSARGPRVGGSTVGGGTATQDAATWAPRRRGARRCHQEKQAAPAEERFEPRTARRPEGHAAGDGAEHPAHRSTALLVGKELRDDGEANGRDAAQLEARELGAMPPSSRPASTRQPRRWVSDAEVAVSAGMSAPTATNQRSMRARPTRSATGPMRRQMHP